MEKIKIIALILFIALVSSGIYFYDQYLSTTEQLRLCSISIKNNDIIESNRCKNIEAKSVACETKVMECLSNTDSLKSETGNCDNRITAINRDLSYYKNNYNLCKTKLVVFTNSTTTTTLLQLPTKLNKTIFENITS